MAKLFYTMDEAQKKLGKTEEEILELVESRQLTDFQDGNRLVFKVEQIDQLALANGQQTPPPQPGTSINGLSEEDVRFLLEELTSAPTVFGLLLTPRAEAALFVFAGKKPEKEMGSGWEEACSVIAARLPSPIVQMLANLLSCEEELDLDQLSLFDEAAFMLANAYTDGSNLQDEKLQSLTEAIMSLAVLIQVNLFVKSASREWIKSTFDPNRDPMDLLTQINEGVQDLEGSLTLFNEAMECDIRTQRLQKIAKQLAA